MPKSKRSKGNNRREKKLNYRNHFLVGTMMAVVGFIVTTLGLSSLPVAETFSFKLSRLLFESSEDDEMNRERPTFSRRDLKEEFGEEALGCLIDSALGLVDDGEVCINRSMQSNAIPDDNGVDNDDDDYMNVPSADGSSSPGSSPLSRNFYGVDVSFPIHYADLESFPRKYDFSASSSEEHTPLADRNDFYRNFMKGCKTYYQHSSSQSPRQSVCDESEADRFDMNKNQPPVMQNYTTLGFQKTKAPKHIMQQLEQFWEENIDIDVLTGEKKQARNNLEQESWHPGDTHTNHWEAPTHMLNIENANLKGGGMGLKQRVWKAAETVLLQWIQTEADASSFKDGNTKSGKASSLKLTPASLYGIRVYKEGAVLAPHVDRLPLVTSAIINVAQDIEEPWPLEVYAHDGNAYNVTLEPGDMLLYESHSVIHGKYFDYRQKP